MTSFDVMEAQSRFDAPDHTPMGGHEAAMGSPEVSAPVTGEHVAAAAAVLGTHWRSHMLGCHWWATE